MAHALVIGGGVAGFATAMSLEKAGIGSTVFEARASKEAIEGSFLMVMRNGLDALAAIDARAAVKSASFPITDVEYRDSDNNILGVHRLGGDASDANRPHVMNRKELYRSLYEEFGERGGLTYFQKKLTRITRRQSAVTAHFADGTNVDGDFIVGADGIRSAVRGYLLPQDSRPSATGQVIAFGESDCSDRLDLLEKFYMVYGKRGFFGCTTVDRTTLWFAQFATDGKNRNMSIESLRRKIADFYRDDETPSLRIIQKAKKIQLSPMLDMSLPYSWFADDVVLVGDAAHAASPAAAQGASMALEDAVTLGKSLRDSDSREQAFENYEHVRRARIERLVAFSAAQAATQARPERSNGSGRSSQFEDPNDRDWLYSHHIEWSQPLSRHEGP